jgi:DNA-binding response OmpR family regulator
MPTFERFRDKLTQRNLVDPTVLATLVGECSWTPMRLPWLLVERGLITELVALQLVSEVCGVPGVDVHKVAYNAAAAAKIPLSVGQRYTVFPMALEGHQLHLAMSDPDNMGAREEIAFGSGCDILPYAALSGRIIAHLEATYGASQAASLQAIMPGTASPIVRGVSLPVVPASAPATPRLELPVQSAPQASVAPAPAPVHDNIIVRPGGPRTILVVEDEAISRELILKALAPTGCTLVAATDGLTGLNMVREREPILVVLDAMLPQVHGFEICRKIKASKRFAQTRVLMVSATYKGWQTAAAIKKTYGADEFLQKPFSMADLRTLVDQLLPPAQAPAIPGIAPKTVGQAPLLQGLAQLKEGNVEAALAALQEAEKIDPFSAEVQHAIGRCHEFGKQPFRAIYYHERAIELNPTLFGALQSLAQLYQDEGFLNKARDYWRRAAENAGTPQMEQTIRAHLGESP